METLGDELIVGTYDLHTHGYPEVRPESGRLLDDVETARYAAEKGIGGYVLKSHVWPTMDRVFHLGLQEIENPVHVVACIALNSIVGGLSAGVLEAAILQGAGAAYLPTWTSHNDLTKGGFSRRIRRELPSLAPFLEHGLSVLDGDGTLTPDARDVLRVAKEYEIMLGTGHLSSSEVLALAAEAERIDFRKMVFTHPDSATIAATDEELVEVANRGVYIEWTMMGLMPIAQRIRASLIAEWIERLGPGRCVLTTDTFGRASLPQPDGMKLFLLTLYELGLSVADLRTMSVTNPREILASSFVEKPLPNFDETALPRGHPGSNPAYQWRPCC